MCTHIIVNTWFSITSSAREPLGLVECVVYRPDIFPANSTISVKALKRTPANKQLYGNRNVTSLVEVIINKVKIVDIV